MTFKFLLPRFLFRHHFRNLLACRSHPKTIASPSSKGIIFIFVWEELIFDFCYKISYATEKLIIIIKSNLFMDTKRTGNSVCIVCDFWWL